MVVWSFYGYIPNVKTFLFSNVRMKKSLFQVGKNFEEKIVVLSSKVFKIVCLFVFRLLASLSCYYDVNPVVALSGPQ